MALRYSRGCRIRRVSVGAGQTVAIKAPQGFACDQVAVGNAASGDLKVYSEDPTVYTTDDNWLIVSPGYDHVIGGPVDKLGASRFAAEEAVLWVKYSDVLATGTVVLIWL